MPRHIKIVIIILLLSSLFLSGCVLLKQKQRAVDTNDMDFLTRLGLDKKKPLSVFTQTTQTTKITQATKTTTTIAVTPTPTQTQTPTQTITLTKNNITQQKAPTPSNRISPRSTPTPTPILAPATPPPPANLSNTSSATNNTSNTSAATSNTTNTTNTSTAPLATPNTPDITKTTYTLHYQLQNVFYSAIKQLSENILVIDIDDNDLTSANIAELKSKNKIVLSYLSIGEAEDYRSYWQTGWKVGNPSFLDYENPDWPGNYKVKYWDTEWQEIIFKQLDKIVLAGYSGAYLDIIDAYEYYEARGRVTAKQEMVNFVKALSARVKVKNNKFLIIPQNAVELYTDSSYKQAIDGMGKEDTWYNNDAVVSQEAVNYVLPYLDSVARDNKFILAIDYPVSDSKICDFYKKCAARGYVCTVSIRALNLTQPIRCQN